MSSLRELNRHLHTVKTVEQMSSAMRSVSSAKYARLSALMGNARAFASACADAAETAGGGGLSVIKPLPGAPLVLVVAGGNRGLCGSCNAELLEFAFGQIENEPSARIITAGKVISQAFSKRGISHESLVLSDVPSSHEVKAFSDGLLSDYSKGLIRGVSFLYPGFINVMNQKPVRRDVLPFKGGQFSQSARTFVFPDRETALSGVFGCSLEAQIYALFLEAAISVQAATMMAMKSSYENAVDVGRNLQVAISRTRQAAVTSGVIEVTSGFTQEDEL